MGRISVWDYCSSAVTLVNIQTPSDDKSICWSNPTLHILDLYKEKDGEPLIWNIGQCLNHYRACLTPALIRMLYFRVKVKLFFFFPSQNACLISFCASVKWNPEHTSTAHCLSLLKAELQSASETKKSGEVSLQICANVWMWPRGQTETGQSLPTVSSECVCSLCLNQAVRRQRAPPSALIGQFP